MTSMAGIVLALLLLMALACRGVRVLVLAPLCALLAVLFSPDAPLFVSGTQVFMAALGGFAIAFQTRASAGSATDQARATAGSRLNQLSIASR